MKNVFVVLMSLCVASFGIVVHSGSDAGPSSRPSDAAVGSWNSNGSCVAISPSCVITTQHQGGSVGSAVEINGATYYVEEIIAHTSADVRVARLAGANFSSYPALNTSTRESGKSVVLGGFGKKRGAELANADGVLWGYQWFGDNSTIGWATNVIDSIAYISGANHLVIDFDLPGATAYEGIAAMYDSGSGIFYYDRKAGWSLYGLCAGVSALSGYTDIAFFQNPALIGVKTSVKDPSSGQKAYYNRVSDYAAWAKAAVATLEGTGVLAVQTEEPVSTETSPRGKKK